MSNSTELSELEVCRFSDGAGNVSIGLLAGKSEVIDLKSAGLTDLTTLLESRDPADLVRSLAKNTARKSVLEEIRLLAPAERQEIWAAGVTYLRSKQARMEESDFSATAYDRVYDA